MGVTSKAMDLTLARQGELGTRTASHKPTASMAKAKKVVQRL